MGWLNDWADAGRATAERAARETCSKHNITKVVGYSKLGIPVICCPECSPELARERTAGEAWEVV